MHYKNGREAKVGDVIVTKDYNGIVGTGVIVKANPGAETCNLTVQPVVPSQLMNNVSARDCIHIEDSGL